MRKDGKGTAPDAKATTTSTEGTEALRGAVAVGLEQARGGRLSKRTVRDISDAVLAEAKPRASLYRVRISPTMAYEFQARDVFDFAWEAGTLSLGREQFDLLLEDAAFYADPESNDMEASTRRVYKALAKQLRGLNA